MVNILAPETRKALRKFYKIRTVYTLSDGELGLVLPWNITNSSIFRQSDLDELMNDPKFLELLTIEHLNGE